MDFLFKKIIAAIDHLRESIDASRDQQQRHHEQREADRQLPPPLIRVEAETHERPDSEVEQRTYRNSSLSAQWITAYATSAAFLAAAIYAGIAACQLRTMNQTYGQTRHALEVTEGANVTIGKQDGKVADIIWPKDRRGNAGIMVYFQNSGRLPARFNWGADSPIIEVVPKDPTMLTWPPTFKGPTVDLPTNHLFQPMYRAKNSHGTEWSGTIDIAGGSTYQGILWEIPRERMIQIISLDRLTPSGTFEYCNGFGKRICKNFKLGYAKKPYDTLLLYMEDECPAFQMQIRHPAPGLQYLPPCGVDISRKELEFTNPSLPQP